MSRTNLERRATASAVTNSATADTSTRKEIAISFLQQASSGKVREAFDAYVGPNFLHHNPFFQGDATALMAGMEENAKQNPHKVLQIKHALEDREIVAIHSHVQLRPSDKGSALVHIFRFKGGRIIEMWDIGQSIPLNSPNEYGMF